MYDIYDDMFSHFDKIPACVGTDVQTAVEGKLFILIHFALNDPYYSPYDVTYDVIGNPHYSASYPYLAPYSPYDVIL